MGIQIKGINNEQVWRGVIEKWKKSGLSQPKFCEREGISLSAFYNWRSKLLKRDGSSKPRTRKSLLKSSETAAAEIKFLPVKVNSFVQQPSFEILTPTGYLVRVSHGAAELSDVLRALVRIKC